MKLKKYCSTLTTQLNSDLIKNTNNLSNDELFKQIKKRINKHHITFNVLRTYAAIFLFVKSSNKDISLENLYEILVEDDTVLKSDIESSIIRLSNQKIISFKGNKYSLIK